ncbi:MAG: response regulator [Planctomycetes bacterium]|nr:response regulator [Planctomycetota bacterium]
MTSEQDTNRRILIIDDNKSIHEDFKAILDPDKREDDELDQITSTLFGEDNPTSNRKFFHIESAYQGQQGLEMIKEAIRREQPFTVAFVDMRMPPGWDGLETIRNIWKVDAHIEIVLATAYSDYSWPEIHNQLDQNNQLIILKKPFDDIEVRQLAHTLCQRRLLADQTRTKIQKLESLIEKQNASHP